MLFFLFASQGRGRRSRECRFFAFRLSLPYLILLLFSAPYPSMLTCRPKAAAVRALTETPVPHLK